MKRVISAGGIITKIENDQLKICLVRLRPPMKGYVFPKGHVELGETYEQTALREVAEETGLSNLTIKQKLGVVQRQSTENDGTQVTKNIHLYLMTTDSFQHNQSDERYEWFTIDEALKALNFIEEKEFLFKNRDQICDSDQL